MQRLKRAFMVVPLSNVLTCLLVHPAVLPRTCKVDDAWAERKFRPHKVPVCLCCGSFGGVALSFIKKRFACSCSVRTGVWLYAAGQAMSVFGAAAKYGKYDSKK